MQAATGQNGVPSGTTVTQMLRTLERLRCGAHRGCCCFGLKKTLPPWAFPVYLSKLRRSRLPWRWAGALAGRRNCEVRARLLWADVTRPCWLKDDAAEKHRLQQFPFSLPPAPPKPMSPQTSPPVICQSSVPFCGRTVISFMTRGTQICPGVRFP